MKRVLVLDNSVDPGIYRPVPRWRELLGETPTVAVNVPSGEVIPPIGGFTHVIVTGSEASIARPEPWFEREEDALRRAVGLGRAVLGSCFGHQILVRAVSGSRFAARRDAPEIGWIEVRRQLPDPLLEDVPVPMRVFSLHFDEVRDPPAPWTVLAWSDECDVQVVRYGVLPVWGIQSHPEMRPEEARDLLERLLPMFPDAEPIIRGALDSEPRDDDVAPAIVRRFLEAGPG